jgi:hypothetical protein
VTAYEVERMVESKLDTKFAELTKTISESKREEAALAEAREMRNLVFELLKDQRTAQPAAAAQNPLVTELIKSQGGLVDTLLKSSLEKKPVSPMDDPLMKILVQELLSSKKAAAPSLGTTSEELRQRIELQRLANDLEMSQADFKDKQDGRAFTRDLASNALSKIGEAAASAYIESQRIKAEAAKAIAEQDRIAKMRGLIPQMPPQPPQPVPVVRAVEPQKPAETPTEQQGAMPGAEPEHKVRGVPDEQGNIVLPCPTCGSPMAAHVGDKQVTCPVCRTSYNASAPVQLPTSKPQVVRVDQPMEPEPIPENLPEPVPDKIPEPVPEPEPVIEPEQVIEPEPPVVEPVPFLDKEPEPDIVPEPVEEKPAPKKPRAKPAPKKKSGRRVVVKKLEGAPLAS